MTYGLKHYFLKEGDSLPHDGEVVPFHIAERDDSTGLDVWMFEPVPDDKSREL